MTRQTPEDVAREIRALAQREAAEAPPIPPDTKALLRRIFNPQLHSKRKAA